MATVFLGVLLPSGGGSLTRTVEPGRGGGAATGTPATMLLAPERDKMAKMPTSG